MVFKTLLGQLLANTNSMGKQSGMKILITGSNGLLGQKVVNLLLKRRILFLATSRGENKNELCPSDKYQEMDICDAQLVRQRINTFKPTHIIHTAAMTNVDACELQPELCWEINVKATQNIFEIAQKNNSHFQLLSTDFVFDGVKGNYSEEEPTHALSHYGNSKIAAEQVLIRSSYSNYSIVRTSLVYGNVPHLSRTNIFLWAKEQLSKQQKIRVVGDQFRAPTWADDLAWACIELCKQAKMGIFHVSGYKSLSIYEIVAKIAAFYAYSFHTVEKVSSTELNQPAKRPADTSFNLTKAQKEIGYKPKTIEETLAKLQ